MGYPDLDAARLHHRALKGIFARDGGRASLEVIRRAAEPKAA